MAGEKKLPFLTLGLSKIIYICGKNSFTMQNLRLKNLLFEKNARSKFEDIDLSAYLRYY